MKPHKTNPSSVWYMLIGFIALLLLGVATVWTLKAANVGATSTALPQTTKMSATSVQVDMEATYAAYQSGGENPPPTAPKDPTLAPAPPTVKPPPFQSGIFPGGGDAFYSGDVTIINFWQNIIGEETVQVFAGSLYEDSKQGLVIVFGSAPTGRFLTPNKVGAVWITQEINLRLVLTSTDGNILYFDVPSHQFVESLKATVVSPSTAMPKPTSTSSSPYPGPTSKPYP